MNLGKKQELFASLVPRLINKAIELGKKNNFTVRPGDYYRDPRVHGVFGEKKGYGHKNSCHKLKLAIDLNLIQGSRILGSKYHKELADWWESQHEFCRNGRRFNDANHYSMTHWGAI